MGLHSNKPKPEGSAKEYRYLVLFSLSLIFMLNIVDRQLLAVLSPAIKQELALSDTQLGWLKGFAFTFLYSLMGLPIAHLADRYSRVNIIFASLTIWSTFTLLSGYAQNFFHFVLARIGFGVGAAGCSPPAHSVIADYFNQAQRSNAISLYTLSLPLGHLVTFALGGWFDENWGWRTTLIVFGTMGLMLVALRLIIHEPEQLDFHQEKRLPTDEPPFIASLRRLISIPSFQRISIAAALGACGVTGLTAWIIDFFYRTELIHNQTLNTMVGLIYGVFGCAGMLIGSYVTAKRGQKNTRNYLITPGIALLLCAPLLVIMLWAGDLYVTLAILCMVIFLMYSFQGTVFSLIPAIVVSRMRSRASALVIFTVNMLGAGLGPLLVGVISDALTSTLPQDIALRWAISCLSFAFLAAGWLFIRAADRLQRDLAE